MRPKSVGSAKTSRGRYVSMLVPFICPMLPLIGAIQEYSDTCATADDRHADDSSYVN